MKVVALVSGGKDSCYNMLMCQRYGHEIVALANLLPAQVETDDLDSYMYQTVGHQVIAAYTRCMGLPLYRRAINGTSRQQELVYEDTPGDEVEDLAALLAYVRERHPDVQAVASGAIASDYQRTRVERVCARLGLVSLAYLWHQPQAALLQAMIDAPIHAILVKIAAAGLTPGRHLGASLAALPAQLHALRRTYGINVCGEGGEYETLTLDCPLFTQGRIVLNSWDCVAVSEDSLAPVALLHPTAFHVELKGVEAEGAAAGAAKQQGVVVQVPPDYHAPPAATPALPPAQPADASLAVSVQLHVTSGSQYASVTAEVPRSSGGSNPPDTGAALAAALSALSAALPVLGLTWQHALFVHLYVPAMSQFAAANAAYTAFFPAVNPPARATVELGTNSQLALVVEVLFTRAPELRRVLHVQSISEWAPSCIGPYSQAVAHAGLLFFAGQIGLHPPTMDVVPGGLERQCVRCLASCQAVAVAQRTHLPAATLWATVYCAEAAGPEAWRRAAHHLSALLVDQLDTSLLHPAASNEAAADASASAAAGDTAGGAGGLAGDAGSSCSAVSDTDSDDDGQLDEYLQPPDMHRHWAPLVTFVTVPQLPRGVLVEIQPVACVVDTTADDSSSSSSDDEEPCSRAAAQRRHLHGPRHGSMLGWIGRLQRCSHGPNCSSLFAPGRLCRAHAVVEGDEASLQDIQGASASLHEALAAAQLEVADLVSCKAYCVASLLGSQLSVAQVRTSVAAGLGGDSVAVTVVPVSAVGEVPSVPAAMLLELLAARHP